GTDKAVTINEDTTYTFTAGDFGFSDPNDSPANAFFEVKITTLPTNGTLSLSGNAVTAGQFIAVADIPNLTFKPAANANGANYANFTFQVRDNGGTTPGVDLDQSPNTFTFNVTAVNDPAIISGNISGNVIEAGGLDNAIIGTSIATGTLTVTDVDSPATFQAVTSATASTNNYGAYTLDSSGHWTYTLDNNNPTVEALNVGQTLTDTFTALTADGTTQLVTITIQGTNDIAKITGTSIGTVVEAGGLDNAIVGTPTVTGTLAVTDVDNPVAFQAVTNETQSVNNYGTYTLTSDGIWHFTLNNDNPTVQALNEGDILTDTFIAFSTDGTPKTITITIHGTNDTPQLVYTGSIDYVVGAPAQIITPELALYDIDSPTLHSATMTMTNWIPAEDIMLFVPNSNTGNIIASIANGSVTLSSPDHSATTEQFESALRSISYVNVSAAPTMTARNITVIVDDGGTQNNLSNITDGTINLVPLTQPTVIPIPTHYNGYMAKPPVIASPNNEKMGGTIEPIQSRTGRYQYQPSWGWEHTPDFVNLTPIVSGLSTTVNVLRESQQTAQENPFQPAQTLGRTLSGITITNEKIASGTSVNLGGLFTSFKPVNSIDFGISDNYGLGIQGNYGLNYEKQGSVTATGSYTADTAAVLGVPLPQVSTNNEDHQSQQPKESTSSDSTLTVSEAKGEVQNTFQSRVKKLLKDFGVEE
ncbi:MAG: VCBS domain-containing protein, partial [Gammaproteobacteria bacterium]|nr:VCBS domain-containing protein [Gammaproteobacteria bacterium]